MQPFLIVFGKYGIEYILDLEEESIAFEDYMFAKLKNNNAPPPDSRVDYVIRMINLNQYKQLQAWAINSDMNAIDLWDAFENDYHGTLELITTHGKKVYSCEDCAISHKQ